MKKVTALAHTLSQKLKNAKHPVAVYILCYTAFFALCALAVFCHFIIRDKSLVWCGQSGNIDGISQHYIALSYWGTYLRSIVRTLFTEGRLSIPLFDTSIGMGSDVIQTLSYYVIGDPLTLVSAVVPRAYTEYLYNFLIIFRLYLAGLSFSAFALHLKKNNRFFTLISSMVYVFSAYALYAAVRHPYFSNPMIYFPLVLLGAEYIFKGKKPWLFILSVTLAGLSNFYFFYMICILTVLYVLVRMFDYCPKGQRKKIWGYLWRFALYAVIAVLMASVLLYPSIRTTLASTRQEGGGAVPLLYNLNHYLYHISVMSTAAGLGEWDFHGHLPLSMLAIVLLWLTPRKQSKTEKRLFLICTVILSVPALGWLLNGMAYVSNRWVWGYNLLIACICAFRLPHLPSLSKKKWAVLALFGLVYAYLASWQKLNGNYYRLGVYGVLTTILLCGGALLLTHKKELQNLLYRSSLVVLVVLQLVDFGMVRYDFGGYADDFIDKGQCFNNVLQAQAAPLALLGDTSYHRYEDDFEDDTSRQKNAALVNGGMSTNIYYSLANDNWYELLRSLGHRDIMVQKQLGLDNRTILGALSNVKYFTARRGRNEGTIPYGYNRTPIFDKWIKNSQYYRSDASGEWTQKYNYLYYENENVLPLGYTYDSYLTREQYDSLNYVDHQRALLYNAVLEEESNVLQAGALPATTNPLQIIVTPSKDVVRKGDTFICYKKGYIDIEIKNADPNKETYLSFRNVDFIQRDPVYRLKEQEIWEDLLPREQKKFEEQAVNFTSAQAITLSAKINNISKNIPFYTEQYTYYAGVHDYCINLGYYEKAPTKIRITLPAHGEYTLQDIAVTQLDLAGYEAQIKALSAEHLQNVKISNNHISGTISVSENKLMCISLPYSEGWSAFVDGKEVQIKQTDIAFMGIELSEGTHTIELRYFTPYLAFGILLSIVGWTVFTLWFIMDLYRNKKKGR